MWLSGGIVLNVFISSLKVLNQNSNKSSEIYEYTLMHLKEFGKVVVVLEVNR